MRTTKLVGIPLFPRLRSRATPQAQRPIEGLDPVSRRRALVPQIPISGEMKKTLPAAEEPTFPTSLPLGWIWVSEEDWIEHNLAKGREARGQHVRQASAAILPSMRRHLYRDIIP